MHTKYIIAIIIASALLFGSASFTHAVLTSEGTLSVRLDASSPSYKIVAGGSDDNMVAVLKFTATGESINLKRVALQLDETTGANPWDIRQVTLWSGSEKGGLTKVGTAIFTGNNYTAFSTLSGEFSIPKDGSRLLFVKADIAKIGKAEPGTSGHYIRIDYDGDYPSGTYGTEQGSGQTIYSSSLNDTKSAGVRMMKSFPSIKKLSLPTNILTNGENVLYRFQVHANGGNVGIYKITAHFVEGGVAGVNNIRDFNIYAYTDSNFSVPVTGLGPDGGMQNGGAQVEGYGDVGIYAQSAGGANTAVQIPAGQTRYFEVKATVSNVSSSSEIGTTINGDAGIEYSDMETVAVINSSKASDFIWSPNSITTSSLTDKDWTNGFGVQGLPSSVMSGEVLMGSETSTSSITVLSPNGGEEFSYGDYLTVTTQIDSKKDNGLVSYWLVDDRANYKQFMSSGGMSTIKNDSIDKATWFLSERLVPSGKNYKIQTTFVSEDGLETLEDFSDAPFSIVAAPTTQPSITILTPNGGEQWQVGDTHTIRWDHSGFTSNEINIYLYDFAANKYSFIKRNAVNNGSYIWEINSVQWIGKEQTKMEPGNYKIYILANWLQSSTGTSISDFSDAPFSITDPIETFSVSLDKSSPSYKIVVGGSKNNTVAVLKFIATDEPVSLKRIALQLSGTGSSPNDIEQVTIWDGATQVGSAIFTGQNRVATSTLVIPVTIPQDGSKLLTIKADVSNIGIGQVGTSGSLIQIDYDGDAIVGTYGIGQSSGASTYSNSRNDTNSKGIRMFKSIPKVEKVSLSKHTLKDGKNILYRFKVTANPNGNIGLYKVTLGIKAKKVNMSNFKINIYSDSIFTNPVPGVVFNGINRTSNNMNLTMWAQDIFGNDSTVQIPAGRTLYLEVLVDAINVTHKSSIKTTLKKDKSYPISGMSSTQTIWNDPSGNFIWSPNSTTTSSITHSDWTNGYKVFSSRKMTETVKGKKKNRKNK